MTFTFSFNSHSKHLYRNTDAVMDASIICRFCLKLQDTISVFISLNGNQPLVDLIFQLLEIEITPNSYEESYLCFDCHHVLQNFNEFKTKCYKNDKEFQNRYQFKQEPEWKLEIEDSVIQSEIHSNIQTLPEEEHKQDLEQECEQEPEWKIEIEDSVIQSEIHSNTQMLPEEELKQEYEQEPEWKIDIEDSVIQSEIHSNIQTLPEEEFKQQLEQEYEQDPEWKIEIEDSVIQSEIHSNIQTFPEETVILSEIIGDKNFESNSTAKDAEITKIRNNDKTKQSTWSEREREKIPCHICKKLIFRACFKVHVSLHDVNHPRFQCQICDRSYKQKHNLTKHLNTHTKKLLFPCKEDNCGKVFDCSSTLQKHHKRKHTNIRDHICKICSRGFAISSALSDHMRGHRNEKKHACAECGKLFKTPIGLRLHWQVHSKRDRYVCPKCNEVFPKASMLKDHKSKVHNLVSSKRDSAAN